MIILNLSEHFTKVPYWLSLFFPIILFFLFGLWLARSKYGKDVKRLKIAIEENHHLTADITRALVPEKDKSKILLNRIEKQSNHWHAALKKLEDELFTEQCRTRDLRKEIEHKNGGA